MLKKSIVISTLLHIVIGFLLFYSLDTIEKPSATKLMPVTLVALAPTPKVEVTPLKPVEKKEIKKEIVKPKPKKPKPKPIVKERKKPEVQKEKKILKPKVYEPKPSKVEQSEPVVQQTEKSIEQRDTIQKPLKPIAVAQKNETQISTAEKINIKNEYLKTIYQEIAKRKVYPRNARKLGQSGVVKVSFRVLADGTITDISLRDKSGFNMLDKAAKKILTNLAKVAAIPKELNEQSIVIQIPIAYKLEF